jgi:hypothetical protein
MKKSAKKLKLHSETLRTLERPALAAVMGGAEETEAPTQVSCAFNAMDGYVRG